MEEKVLKISACFCAILTVIACCAMFFMPKVHALTLKWDVDMEKTFALGGVHFGTEAINTDADKKDFPQQLRVKLPTGCDAQSVEIKQNYMEQTVDILIPAENGDFLYDKPLVGSAANIDDVVMDYAGGKAVIEIVLDSVMEVEQTYDANYLYLDFLSPHEVYDKVVVIDAGHGKKDPGAVKQGICEKDIDLAIVKQLKELLDTNESIGVYYTRLDDTNPSYNARVELANKAQADLFISIHNNSTTGSRLSKVQGTEVMYDEQKSDEQSKAFAQICLEEVTGACGSEDKGLVKGNSIYIIRTSEVPVALIEVGFMTNAQELSKLNDAAYQKQVAQGIYQAIIRAFEEGY